MRKASAYMCGVPKGDCGGTLLTTNRALDGVKGHGSPEDAFNCMRRHLLRQGYTQVGSRDFRPPDGGPIRVLTKKSRYGGKLRSGKEGTRNMPTKLAKHRHGGMVFST